MVIELERPPTAVFAANDAMALGPSKNTMSRRCRGVAVAGFDDVPEARKAGLTTVRPPLRRLAVQAGRALRGVGSGTSARRPGRLWSRPGS